MGARVDNQKWSQSQGRSDHAVFPANVRFRRFFAVSQPDGLRKFRSADRRARQHPPRRQDVRTQLRPALLDTLGERSIELVESGGGITLTGSQCYLGGGLVVADSDVGVDPFVGLPPLVQQLIRLG